MTLHLVEGNIPREASEVIRTAPKSNRKSFIFR